jgi:hypothetical protein
VRLEPLAIAVALAACTPSSSLVVVEPGRDAVVFHGNVRYESRSSTPSGASSALELRPARFVRLFALYGGGPVAEGITDEHGAFSIAAPPGSTLRVITDTRAGAHSHAVTVDPLGRIPYAIDVALADPNAAVDLIAREADPRGIAGAFHIVDTTLRGAQVVERWTGQVLPPLYTYWGRGITTQWSFYRGERPAGSGRYCLELLGGNPGEQATSDTDEHDESIVLHEFGHFVMERLTSDSSAGGMHPSGYLVEPGLAWEEGRASWFAQVVLGNPWYLDTIGLEPHGRLRVAHDLERGGQGPRGIGSEDGVSEILWDLADGAGGLPDQDADPIALGPEAVFRAMVGLAQTEGAFPAISTFLSYAVAQRVVERDALRAVLVQGGHPPDVLPPNAGWPSELALPSTIGAKIDGVTNPAPSGGPNRPENGFDAVHVYKVRVPSRARLTAELRIHGSGRVADQQDLDLEVRTLRAEMVASARTEAMIERISQSVEAGWYVVYVRDGGAGNRVGYDLRVSFNPE